MKIQFLLVLFFTCYVRMTLSCVLVSGDESNLPKLISEKTLIIWDSQQKIESFIRIPQISANNDQVGFIVPVPNVPEVSDISKNVFDDLEQIMEKKRPVKYVLGRLMNPKNADVPHTIGGLSTDDLDDSVRIIKKFNLAQYEVLVIKSNDLDQLSKWMDLNGFKMRDAVKKWIQIYVEKNFYFTVFKFKLNTKQDKNNLTTYPVQIRFNSEHPYYPYHEPEDSPANPNRVLNLYFLSDGYYSPVKVSADMVGYNSPIFASQIDNADVSSLKLNLSKTYLLKWDDLTTKRPAFDLAFDRDDKITKPILLPAKIILLSDFIKQFGTTIMYSVMFFALIYIFLRKDKIYEQLFQYRSLIGLSLLVLSVVWSFLFAKVHGVMNETFLFLINCNYVLILSYGVASLFRKNYKAAFFDILVFPLFVGVIVFVIFFKTIKIG